jgi:DNA-binding CsgD family transcriptional regulator
LRALTDGLDDAHSPRLELALDLPPLSAREAQVARLAAEGMTSRQIADQLDVSKRTVDNQLGRVYEKLGIAGRADLAAVMAS